MTQHNDRSFTYGALARALTVTYYRKKHRKNQTCHHQDTKLQAFTKEFSVLPTFWHIWEKNICQKMTQHNDRSYTYRVLARAVTATQHCKSQTCHPQDIKTQALTKEFWPLPTFWHIWERYFSEINPTQWPVIYLWCVSTRGNRCIILR